MEDRDSKINFLKHSLKSSGVSNAGNSFDDEMPDEDILIVIKKKYKSDIDDEQASLFEEEGQEKNLLILRKDFYLPKNKNIKEKMQKIAKAYFYFNNFMIIMACLSHFLEDTIQRSEEKYFFGILDLVFLIQFSVHILCCSIV